MIITKEKFTEYKVCQSKGYFNMLDYNSWKDHTTLTEDEWFEIIKNYNKYYEGFKQ